MAKQIKWSEKECFGERTGWRVRMYGGVGSDERNCYNMVTPIDMSTLLDFLTLGSLEAIVFFTSSESWATTKDL